MGFSPTCRGFADRSLNARARCHAGEAAGICTLAGQIKSLLCCCYTTAPTKVGAHGECCPLNPGLADRYVTVTPRAQKKLVASTGFAPALPD